MRLPLTRMKHEALIAVTVATAILLVAGINEATERGIASIETSNKQQSPAITSWQQWEDANCHLLDSNPLTVTSPTRCSEWEQQALTMQFPVAKKYQKHSNKKKHLHLD